MPNNDWSNLGNNIRDIVQDAIDSQDFNKLNDTINKTINGTMENVGKTFNGTVQNVGKTIKNVSKTAEQNMQEYKTTFKMPTYQKKSKPPALGNSSLFYNPKSTRAGGIALSIIGYMLGSLTGIAISVLLLVSLFRGVFGLAFRIPVFILIPFFIGGVFMASKGSRMLKLTKRFKLYVHELHGKTYCQLDELTKIVKKSKGFIKKDLNKMIERQWFKQGHMDKAGTYLMVSHESYEQFQSARKSARERELREQTIQDNLTPQVKDIIMQGEEYIKKIQASNEAILGTEISAKISYMEMVIKKIFQRLEQHPESAMDLRKLMDYYLPTTVKLLDAYEQLEGQPIQGDNIRSSKREIEKTLDTLNIAFEKLLDSLFKDTAWDVSSDISVLHTILAQEGLTGNDFRKGE